ncbi:sensor histidine kinase [Testudinibacter sp. P27/CKL/0425]
MSYSFRLHDLLDIKQLEVIQHNFSKALGVALVVVDEKGVPVIEPSGFSTFCNLARMDCKQAGKCFECDNAGGRAAMSASKPIFYRCYCGFVEFAVPLIVHDQYLGAFISGQIRVEPEKEKHIPYIIDSSDDWKKDNRLVHAHQEANYLPYEKFVAAAHLLLNVTQSLAEQSYSNNIQKELHAKSIKLAEEQRNNAELEGALRDAEYKALSYQINPHFLFNVLNTIGRLAFLEDANQTEDIVYNFSDMMRYILNKSDNKLITIGTEINSIESYLAIQQCRMKDRFSYEIHVDEKYSEVTCPFLILQPLVENCFNYAVEPREEKSHIMIKANDNGKDVFLTVNDNGDGIEQNKINSILSGMIESSSGKGIGLKNVHDRLKLSFGEEYGIHIYSANKKGMGTTVQLRVPMVKMN